MTMFHTLNACNLFIKFFLADLADPCKFMACDEFSECSINPMTQEANCICKPGYKRIDGQLCQSICDLEPSYCSEGDICEIESGKGAVCR